MSVFRALCGKQVLFPTGNMMFSIRGTRSVGRATVVCATYQHSRYAQVKELSRTTHVSEKFKIYTRTGDEGTTALYTNERRAKDDIVFTALGNTDELSSFIGLAREHCIDANNGMEWQLEEIQCRLLELGSHIATPRDTDTNAGRLEKTKFDSEHTDLLETWIDTMDDTLPPLQNFILASGGKASSALHCCRSICRRTERSLVKMRQTDSIDPPAYKYVNRLSDYFFTAARHAAHFEGASEVVFRSGKRS